jgi:two-component system CheB/CheR fusion protein
MFHVPSQSQSSSGRPEGAIESEAIRSSSEQQEQPKPRALVVDDARDVTEMLAMFLQHAGYDPVMAFTAKEALEAAHTEQFDVIVSDIGMPEMDGYELAIRLRELPGYEAVPMIAVTGFSMYDDRRRALESGFNAHLTKPINPSALLELIKRLRD